MTEAFRLHRGPAPLLISMPHVGTTIPADQQQRYTARALESEDTDWFVDQLYAFAADRGATLLTPHYSRYLIDLNRSRDNAPMYAGQNNTELCPTRHFSGDLLYRDAQAPNATEVARRTAQYWQPYHDALQHELARLKQLHGHVVLLDAHSIKSELPWLFDGQLPHLNVGTADGQSCAVSLTHAVMQRCEAQTLFSSVLNGRFKGGHITRHYGNPDACVHALQLEMAWRTYMHEAPPYRWDATRAAAISPFLHTLVDTLLTWAP
jgi:N-formylglutamate deformylase